VIHSDVVDDIDGTLALEVSAVLEYLGTVVHYTVLLVGLWQVTKGTGNVPAIIKGLNSSRKITIVLDWSIVGFPTVRFGGIELESYSVLVYHQPKTGCVLAFC
jgi:hypothetical protein